MTIAVQPGQAYTVVVGEGGKQGTDNGGDGGWPNGGYGTKGDASGPGGGGLTGVFASEYGSDWERADPIVIAGSGGGGGYQPGGAGGGENGNNGGGGSTNGATQTHGGRGGQGVDGEYLRGGDGDQRGEQNSQALDGGGGGAGYFGGEGGCSDAGGGSGGSGFCDTSFSSACTTSIAENGHSVNDGPNSPPGAGELGYIAGCGEGRRANGGNGCVSVSWDGDSNQLEVSEPTLAP